MHVIHEGIDVEAFPLLKPAEEETCVSTKRF